jgi:membrane protein
MSHRRKRASLNIRELAQRVWRESLDDDVFGTAAELSYYLLLALFPLLIFLTSAIGFIPGANNSLLSGLNRVLPPDAMVLVRDTLADVISHRSGGLLSFGLIGTLWAASSGMASLMNALNGAYETAETRSFWKRRLVALGLTLAIAFLVVGGSALILIGYRLGNWLERALDVSKTMSFVSTIIGYLTGLGLLLGGIAALFYFGPDSGRKKKRVMPGAVFASAGIVIGSLLFSWYLRLVPSVSATYGSLGAVVTLMLWLYLMGLMLLIGAEINSELD